MTKHDIGDLVLFSLTAFDDGYQLGVVIDIVPDAYMPYVVKWFNFEYPAFFSDKTIRKFKMNFNKLKKQKLN